MRNLVRIAAAAAALSLAAPAAAQPTATQPGNDGRFGIGIGLTDGPITPGAIVFVPMNVSPNLRVEPFLAVDRTNFDDNGPRESDFTLGAGVFFVQPIVSQVQMYVGGRLGLHWESSRDAAFKTERRDTALAAVLGGEFLPHPRFAVGAEGMLGYVAIGEEERTNRATGVVTESPSGSQIATQGTVFLRVYLF